MASKRPSPIKRGFLVALAASAVGIGISFATLPHFDAAKLVAADEHELEQNVAVLDGYLLTRFVTSGAETWSPHDITKQLSQHPTSGRLAEVRGAIAGAPAEIGHRVRVGWILEMFGVLAVWFGMATMFRLRGAAAHVGARTLGRGAVAGIVLIGAGLWLPCIPLESARGLVFSIPPNAIGVIAMVAALVATRHRAGVASSAAQLTGASTSA